MGFPDGVFTSPSVEQAPAATPVLSQTAAPEPEAGARPFLETTPMPFGPTFSQEAAGTPPVTPPQLAMAAPSAAGRPMTEQQQAQFQKITGSAPPPQEEYTPVTVLSNPVGGLELSQDQSGDDLIWKVACKSGTLALSPGPNQTDLEKPLHLTKDLFMDMVESLEAKAFPHITVPESHANGPLENTGYVEAAEVLSKDQLLRDPRLGERGKQVIAGDPEDTHYLLAGIEFKDPVAKRKAKCGALPDVSIGVKYDFRNKTTGRKFRAAWNHLALTPVPWRDGLPAFGLSQADEIEDVYVHTDAILVGEGGQPPSLRLSAPDIASTSTMVALYPSPRVAERLAVPSGVDASKLHLTLAYLGDITDAGDLTKAQAAVQRATRGVNWARIHAKISGPAVFKGAGDGGTDACVALVNSPKLDELQAKIVAELKADGLPVSTKHGFTPHITLDYRTPASAVSFDVDTQRLVFATVRVVQGDQAKARVSIKDAGFSQGVLQMAVFDEKKVRRGLDGKFTKKLAALEKRHPGVDLWVSEGRGGEALDLKMIRTKKENRGKGLAAAALKDLHELADAEGVKVTLTPDATPDPEADVPKGLSNTQLRKWYKSKGYVENKGRNKDWSTMAAMIRKPQGTELSADSTMDLVLSGEIEGVDPQEFKQELAKQRELLQLPPRGFTGGPSQEVEELIRKLEQDAIEHNKTLGAERTLGQLLAELWPTVQGKYGAAQFRMGPVDGLSSGNHEYLALPDGTLFIPNYNETTYHVVKTPDDQLFGSEDPDEDEGWTPVAPLESLEEVDDGEGHAPDSVDQSNQQAETPVEENIEKQELHMSFAHILFDEAKHRRGLDGKFMSKGLLKGGLVKPGDEMETLQGVKVSKTNGGKIKVSTPDDTPDREFDNEDDALAAIHETAGGGSAGEAPGGAYSDTQQFPDVASLQEERDDLAKQAELHGSGKMPGKAKIKATELNRQVATIDAEIARREGESAPKLETDKPKTANVKSPAATEARRAEAALRKAADGDTSSKEHKAKNIVGSVVALAKYPDDPAKKKNLISHLDELQKMADAPDASSAIKKGYEVASKLRPESSDDKPSRRLSDEAFAKIAGADALKYREEAEKPKDPHPIDEPTKIDGREAVKNPTSLDAGDEFVFTDKDGEWDGLVTTDEDGELEARLVARPGNKAGARVNKRTPLRDDPAYNKKSLLDDPEHGWPNVAKFTDGKAEAVGEDEKGDYDTFGRSVDSGGFNDDTPLPDGWDRSPDGPIDASGMAHTVEKDGDGWKVNRLDMDGDIEESYTGKTPEEALGKANAGSASSPASPVFDKEDEQTALAAQRRLEDAVADGADPDEALMDILELFDEEGVVTWDEDQEEYTTLAGEVIGFDGESLVVGDRKFPIANPRADATKTVESVAKKLGQAPPEDRKAALDKLAADPDSGVEAIEGEENFYELSDGRTISIDDDGNLTVDDADNDTDETIQLSPVAGAGSGTFDWSDKEREAALQGIQAQYEPNTLKLLAEDGITRKMLDDLRDAVRDDKLDDIPGGEDTLYSLLNDYRNFGNPSDEDALLEALKKMDLSQGGAARVDLQLSDFNDGGGLASSERTQLGANEDMKNPATLIAQQQARIEQLESRLDLSQEILDKSARDTYARDTDELIASYNGKVKPSLLVAARALMLSVDPVDQPSLDLSLNLSQDAGAEPTVVADVPEMVNLLLSAAASEGKEGDATRIAAVADRVQGLHLAQQQSEDDPEQLKKNLDKYEREHYPERFNPDGTKKQEYTA